MADPILSRPINEGIPVAGTIGEALTEFYADLALADKAPETIRSYRTKLKRLDPTLPLVAFDRAYCRQLMMESMRLRSAGTSRTYHTILQAFASWCVREGALPASPMSGVPRPKGPDNPPSSLSERQLAAVIAACQTDRERLVLALLCGTGLRRSELAGALWQDVDWERRCLTVIGKGRRRRVVLIPRDALAMLEPVRRRTGLILGVCDETVYRTIKTIGKRAGLPGLHPHSLRHTFATNWLLKGGSIFNLVTLGGWADDHLVRSTYGRAGIERAALDEAARMEG
jgi:integrase/recombinase XerC